MDSDKQREDGHNASPIWVSDRPESEQTAAAKPSAPTSTYAPVERASVRSLLQQPRFRRLRNRLLAAVGVALVVGFLVGDWRVGVTAGVVAAILEAVYRARSNSSVPAWRRASVAERRTEAQLRKLERLGYRTLHARAIPNSEAQIDHLVVGPTGVYAVDSEKWDKRLPVRVQMGKKLFHGPFDQKARLNEAKWEASQAGELISRSFGREVSVVPSLAIYGPAVPWKIMTIRGVDVYQGDRARKWITKRERALTAMEIDRIYDIAARELPARYGED
ncbi:nuclease-related domain-containing protein [Nonomuraea turcica]|uniref:nuclease-related domain-containing protein n=1 Tax=Nonomuraea sp. G32 TaxID=3067274 RepID=UPI00273B547A|nr:nuclease-related domain-containing protein [Nonomuraea sp. G32]MDP4501494.1 nuclease-related domain-containing protein [Nonomuraea sp. G32]